MSDLAGPGCPECGRLRAADGTPTCSCTRRAAEARRETRTAEAAAAEDFDPVRIRPFVAIDDGSAAQEAASGEAAQPADGTGPSDGTSTFAASPDLDGLPAPTPSDDAPSRRRRPRSLLVAGGGAAVAVLVTGGVIGGVFWYESPARDDSASSGVRAGLPAQRSSEQTSSSASPSRAATSAASSTASASSAPRATPSARGTTPAAPGHPSATAPTATATATGTPAPSEPGGGAPVLRYGDTGPEVVELQLRLAQIGFYDGAADGDFDRQVQNAVGSYQLTRVILKDPSGVYGAATRASLEAETKEP
ncbi:peptidoglycan-binding domain-containing protein [Streptomyces sediminimaris]|uniref:peptidoglycan-binding domain-containing protein n=1 Tax=Streptomyces sediminimaris TaxID=3383721 RepID=UPI00399A8578